MGILDSLFGSGFTPAPVSPSRRDAGIDTDYRLERDSEHVIRLVQDHPPGMKILFRETEVAGISREPFCSNAEQFMDGTERRLLLEPEPDHPKDKNAIKIIAQWKSGWGQSTEQIGYIPKSDAKEMYFTWEIRILLKNR